MCVCQDIISLEIHASNVLVTPSMKKDWEYAVLFATSMSNTTILHENVSVWMVTTSSEVHAKNVLLELHMIPTFNFAEMSVELTKSSTQCSINVYVKIDTIWLMEDVNNAHQIQSTIHW